MVISFVNAGCGTEDFDLLRHETENEVNKSSELNY